MKDLTITLIQTNLYWENPTANLAMLEEKIFGIEAPTDLIVLPEMFTTGFTMNAQKFAERMNQTTFKWMKQMAAQTKAVITGSFVVKEHEKIYNRMVWMQPDGSYDFYDKRHLFRMGAENEVFSRGNQLIIKELKGWKICPLICYDLRFPVWSRNIALKYDLLLYVASWPSARIEIWNTLLKARAIENLSYSVGVNRIGTDGNNEFYSGESEVVDFKGKLLFYEKENEIIHTQTLSMKDLIEFRHQFPANLDADDFELKGF